MDLLAEAANTYGIHSTTPDEIVRRPRATMNQTKWEVLKRMVISKSPTKDLAITIGIGERTARKYQAIVEDGGQPSFNTKRRPWKKNNALQEEVLPMIVTNNCLTLKEIQSLLLPQTKQSTSTICWTIKAIGFTQKRTKPVVVARNEDGVIELRATYSHMYGQFKMTSWYLLIKVVLISI